SAGERLSPLIGLIPALITLLLARFLWTRSARDRRARALLLGAILLALGSSYLDDLGRHEASEFHGLLTPQPGSSFVEDYALRPHAHYDFNAHGFRKPEWAIEKAKGTLRVALVGDSFVFGSGVEQPDTLSAQLVKQTTRRFSGRVIEVLNLGISGDNLGSHVRVIELADELLDADITVLCLTLPNDLSRWDGQDEHREPGRIGLFSLVSWTLGTQSAIVLWDMRTLARDYTDDGLTFLRAQMDRLRAFRTRRGERPLLVFTYQDPPEGVRAPIVALPGVTLLPPADRRLEYFIPGDGHPTGAGNEAFSAVIADALAELPVLRRDAR
ncbi:MAG: SGNH/GDSL hydrolase family protein, partial [Minicystis sp.]